MEYEIMAGTSIDTAAKEMVKLAASLGETVTGRFNDILLTVNPGDSAQSVTEAFWKQSNARREAYLASPEYAEGQRQLAAREATRRSQLERAMHGAPEKMTTTDADAWNSWVTANTDPYGAACISFAERWGRLMEGAVSAGRKLTDCADELSHIADTEGITGFMYGCAVSMLSQCWIHGEELRQWHNLKTQVGDEGEKANASGGVLNPSLLIIDNGE